MKRVAIYTRVSTDRQESENQRRELLTFVDRHDEWELAGEYTDEESGGTKNRSNFQRLFDDAHKRTFDVVLFWALDRFSREGTRATLNHLHELESYGVDFVSYTERYLNTTGEFKEAIIGLMAALARQERIRLSDRVKAGMARAKAEGAHVGRPRTPGDIRSRIRELAAEGNMSKRAIARTVGTSPATVRRVLNA